MTAPTGRPRDGSCARWVGDHYCRRIDGTRYFAVGSRCPAHTPNALAGLPENQPGPGIPAYQKGPSS